MAQHDYVIENAAGAAVRFDINNVLQAIITNNSGATEPATTYPNMWWYDTSTGLLKRRNNANDAWITVGLEAADTDGTLAANSDLKIATQKATKTYADTKAAKGANSDITSLSGLTTPLSTAQGGTGKTANANAANGVVVNDANGYLVGDGRNLTNLPLPTGILGAWASKSQDTVYQATTDGFVVAYTAYPGSAGRTLTGYTDGSNPPTTVRAFMQAGQYVAPFIIMPVRKGDYWKLAPGAGQSATVFWLPLGS